MGWKKASAVGGVSIPLWWGLIWISDTSSSTRYGLEEPMKQPLEAIFLFLHRVLSRRSMAAGGIVL